MKFKTTLFAGLLALTFGSAHALTEGTDYEVVKQPVEALHQDKIEVVEFFSYDCIHCKNLDPILLKHVRSLPSDTYFRTEQVVWSPRHAGLARLAVAVNQSGLKQQANPAIFSAVFDKHIELWNPTTAVEWIGRQRFGKRLLAAYQDSGNAAKAKQMAELTTKYNIEGTPTVIIGGKYKMLFSHGLTQQSMQTMDELIAKVRKERNMPEPAAKGAYKSKGLSLSKEAAR